MPAPKGNKNAQKKIDWKVIDRLLEYSCTEDEIAHIIGVHVDTLTNRCKKDKGMLFSEYIKKGSSLFKMSLRREMYKSMRGEKIPIRDENGEIVKDPETKRPVMSDKYNRKPSVTMQIWLSKQWLGYTDKISQTVEEKNTFADWIREVKNSSGE